MSRTVEQRRLAKVSFFGAGRPSKGTWALNYSHNGHTLEDKDFHGAARKQDEDGLITASGESRALALFRLVLSFMAVMMLAFVLVEGWRTWRDYRHAFSNAENMVTNLARATSQHAEDAIRQVDAITAALAERIEGDGFAHLDRPRLHALLAQQRRSCRSCMACSCLLQMVAGW